MAIYVCLLNRSISKFPDGWLVVTNFFMPGTSAGIREACGEMASALSSHTPMPAWTFLRGALVWRLSLPSHRGAMACHAPVNPTYYLDLHLQPSRASWSASQRNKEKKPCVVLPASTRCDDVASRAHESKSNLGISPFGKMSISLQRGDIRSAPKEESYSRQVSCR